MPGYLISLTSISYCRTGPYSVVAVLDAGFAAVEDVEEFAFAEGDGDVDDESAFLLETIFFEEDDVAAT